MDDLRYSQNLRLILITIALVAGLLALYSIRMIVVGTLIGVGFGVLLIPLMGTLERRFRIPRALSAVLVVLSSLGGLVLLIGGIGHLVAAQSQNLASRIPQIVESARHNLEGLFQAQPWLQEQLNSLDAGGTFGSVLQGIFTGFHTGIVAVASLIFIIAIAVYTGIHSERYQKGILTAFPARSRERAVEIMAASATSLRSWFFGQLLVMASVGTLATLGLWVIGIDFWLLFGVMSAIFDIVPYVGSFLSLLIVLFVTLGAQPDHLVAVLILYLVLGQIEGNVLAPMIMRGRAKLSEVHLLVLMLIMGQWFGIAGVFIAPAVLAAGRTIYLMTYARAMDQKLV